jgi:DNA damage-binding protein 1
MRTISLVVQYYPQHETLEEVARDYLNVNWTTAVVMLTDDVYLGGEQNWNNPFALKCNTKAHSEDIRCTSSSERLMPNNDVLDSQ